MALDRHIEAVLAAAPPTDDRIELDEDRWRQRLEPDRFRVLRRQGTEPPFTGEYEGHHQAGTYHCAGCDNPLFSSADKYDSGSGWPSFTRPLEPGRLALERDERLGMARTEVHCARCGGHQGHVFDDGPPPTGQRYCMNSLSLRFHSAERG